MGNQCPGSLIAALIFTVNGGYLFMTIVIQCFYCLDKSVLGPGMVCFVNILQGICGFKQIIVDCHAVGGHADRKCIEMSVLVTAGRAHGGADFRSFFGEPQIG